MGIIEFMLARIHEDQMVALDESPVGMVRFVRGGQPYLTPASFVGEDGGEPAWAAHGRAIVEPIEEAYVVFSPARVLADCVSKQYLLSLHQPRQQKGWCSDQACACNAGRMVCSCDADHEDHQRSFPCETLIALVQPFSAHPDYDPAWAAA